MLFCHQGLISIRQTFDGGYILAGNSNSDISGDKTQAHWGNVFTYDYWIVKTDSLGIKQWDKNFGGLGPDELNSIQQTSDGGYIIGGTSASTINGDKTQPNWGTYLSSIEQTNDGGYIIGGYSYSQISGDKSQNGWGSEDYWIVKTDSICNKQWDKDFGATYFDHLYSVHQTPDGGYLLSGSSTSDSVGDKTENNLGPQQTWFLKTNSIGNKQWDKTVFTLGGDQPGLTIQTRDNCYAVGTTNSSGIGGYKTQPPWNNSSDYWIIKFCDSTLTTNIANTEKENDQLLLWPNPTEGKLAIGSRQYAISTIDIYNTLGELVLTTAVNREPLTVNCEPFPPGIYFVKAFAGEKVLFGKVIKE
ncbi:MAG: T9SS type A sorting domain-containing protein [Bacteroidetes bacterium]|nr:T9SS type A sorting domain-containing protein [Bacteroidota bacterium]